MAQSSVDWRLSVDTHAHVLPARYVESLTAQAAHHEQLAPAMQMVRVRVPQFYPPECSEQLFGPASARIAAMDQAGLGRQALSAGSFTCYATGTPDEVRIELVQAWNDATAEYVAAAPDRLSMFISLPLPCVSAAVAEVGRMSSTPGAIGYGLPTHVGGRPLDDPDWHDLYAALDDLAATVFIHPDRFCVPGVMPRHLETDLGTQFDDALATVRLYESVTSRFPRITWIISHLGGAFPFLLGRLEEHWERDRHWREHDTAPSQSLGQLRFDTAGHSPQSIEFAARLLGSDSILLGTDFPMVSPEDLGAVLSAVRSAIPDPAARRAVFGQNARELLNL